MKDVIDAYFVMKENIDKFMTRVAIEKACKEFDKAQAVSLDGSQEAFEERECHIKLMNKIIDKNVDRRMRWFN